MNEIISGIRVIKMYTWEGAFNKLITRLRRFKLTSAFFVPIYTVLCRYLTSGRSQGSYFKEAWCRDSTWDFSSYLNCSWRSFCSPCTPRVEVSSLQRESSLPSLYSLACELQLSFVLLLILFTCLKPKWLSRDCRYVGQPK